MTAMLHWVWQGLLVAALVAVTLRALPRLDGATRHAIWWVALAAVLVLPLVWPEAVSAPAEAAADATVLPGAALALPPVADWVVALLVGAWLGWVVLGAARLAGGLRELPRLRARSWPLPFRLEAGLTRWHGLPPRRRPAEVRVSPDIQGACAIGLGRPVILLSRRLASALDVEALDHLVLHEQAHLDRRDDWSRLAQLAIGCLVGFHPAVAYITRQIDLEREVACDERVVAATRARRTYARSLAEAAAIVARARTPWRPGVVPGALESRGALRTRVLRLLTRVAPVSRFARVGALTGSVAAAFVALVTASAAGPLVVFADVLVEGPALVSASLDRWKGSALRLPEPVAAVAGPTSARRARRGAVPPREHLAPPAAVALPVVGDRADDPTVDPPRPEVPLEARSLSVSLTPGASGPAGAFPVGAIPGPWTSLQATDAGFGRAAARAGAAVGTAAGDRGTGIGRTATRAGRSIGAFFGRAGAAVAGTS